MKLIFFVLFAALPMDAFAAWTANIVGASRSQDGKLAQITIKFTDGVNTHELQFQTATPTDESIKEYCRNQIKQFANVDLYVKGITIGPVDTGDAVLTESEMARKKFFSDFLKLESLNRLVDSGVLEVNAKDYMDLKATLTSTYRKEYFDLP